MRRVSPGKTLTLIPMRPLPRPFSRPETDLSRLEEGACMSWLDDTKENQEKLLEQLKRNTVIPFIGAGMSCPIYPSWHDYLNMVVNPGDRRASDTVKKMLKQKPCNYEDILQYLQDRGGLLFFERTREIFSKQKIREEQINQAAFAIPQLFCGPIITTNLDQSLEWLYEKRGIPLPVGLANDRQFICSRMAKSQPCLWKIHGDIDKTESWVLCTNDYKKLYESEENSRFLDLFNLFLQSRTLLFLGASLQSDKIVQLLQDLFSVNHDICHFAILPLNKQLQKPNSLKYFDELNRLSNMGIRPIWYAEGDYSAFANLVWDLVKKTGRSSQEVYCSEDIPNRFSGSGYLERTSELEEIKEAFAAGRRFVVLRGISGIGKTELAKAYLSQARESTISLKCSDPKVFQQNLYDFLKWDGQLPQEQAFTAQQNYRDLFLKALDRRFHYLVLFDDVNHDEIFKFIEGMPDQGKYLITTCQQSAGSLNAHLLSVATMTHSEAAYILKTRNPQLDACGDSQETDSLIKKLNSHFGGIPLALVQAADYMAKTGEGLRTYLKLVSALDVQGEKVEIFLRPADNLHKGIWASFSITYQTLQERAKTDPADQTALDILAWCSVLNPDSIDMEFLAKLMGLSALNFFDRRIRLNDGIERLRSYSIIEKSNDVISIKEIIQDLVRCKLGKETISSLTARVGTQLRNELTTQALLPYNYSSRLPYLKHAQKLLPSRERWLGESTTQFLYANLSESALIRGDLAGAEDYLSQMEFPDKLISIWCTITRGFLFEIKGQYTQALEIIERLHAETEDWKKAFQAQFPVRYVQWKQLEAFIYNDFLETDSAEEALESAFAQLDICKEQGCFSRDDFGYEKLKMELINIRGTLFSNKGDMRQAADLYQEVLTMGETLAKTLAKRAIDPDEPKERYETLVLKFVSELPSYVYAYGNLALTKFYQGGPAEESRDKLIQQGEWMQQMYKGAIHPDMASQQYGLGCCYAGLEESVEKQKECFENALQILKNSNCGEHLLAAQIHLQMGILLVQKNFFKEAYKHFDKGLKILHNLRQSSVRLGLETLFLFYKAYILASWKDPTALDLWDQLCETRQIPVSQEWSVFNKMDPRDIQKAERFIKRNTQRGRGFSRQ